MCPWERKFWPSVGQGPLLLQDWLLVHSQLGGGLGGCSGVPVIIAGAAATTVIPLLLWLLLPSLVPRVLGEETRQDVVAQKCCGPSLPPHAASEQKSGPGVTFISSLAPIHKVGLHGRNCGEHKKAGHLVC